ncbi:hypothetical protein Hypma_013824 [Hypsizygus marmoreus]|uniref:Beta-lactamase-related domain-containing protein n=1 Tax=Hypsizygus marmoreus TaxID=39966 RepID=A0A369K5X9_HYPMA|nr:hypothetical protein Hypma_013824 [Hypsizygus marmoreus]
MHSYFGFLCLVSYFLKSLPQVLCQRTHANVLTNETDAFINRVLADWNSPGGIAVAVVRKDDQGAWNVETKGYGAATANGDKVTENTLFGIGSNSKLFTILATGLLINNATLSPRLEWTSKMASILPTWGLWDTTAAKEATIIDVMSHRTGLPGHDFSYKWSDDVPRLIEKMKYQRPSAEFRDVFQYSNNMYSVLSYLPTVLLPSKIPFTRYVKQTIFDRLNMTSTTYSFSVARSTGLLADGMARQGINFSDNPFGGIPRALPFWATAGNEDGNLVSGGAGIISNAVDLAIWLQTLLSNGLRPGTNESVIPAEVTEKVSAGVSVQAGAAQFPELSPLVYGGGAQRGTYRGHEILERGGSIPGFNTQVARLPFDNLGVAVLTNDNDYGSFIIQVIKGRLLDEALGLDKIDWHSRFKALALTTPPRATPRPTNASLPWTDFITLTGTYDNPGYGKFELCLIAPKHPGASRSCAALASNAPTILPGAVEADIPTFLAEWDNPGFSHIRLTHFNGNVFNLSTLSSFPANDSSKPYWTHGGDSSFSSGAYAEAAAEGRHVGIGFTGIWGAGAGVPGPIGSTVRERAEVWFHKIPYDMDFHLE